MRWNPCRAWARAPKCEDNWNTTQNLYETNVSSYVDALFSNAFHIFLHLFLKVWQLGDPDVGSQESYSFQAPGHAIFTWLLCPQQI